MLVQSKSAVFLIELEPGSTGCVTIKSDSELELSRLFGSLRIQHSTDFEMPFLVKACKQEYADAMLLLVKEIDYSRFSMLKV